MKMKLEQAAEARQKVIVVADWERKILVALGKEGKITDAARSLELSPTTVSRVHYTFRQRLRRAIEVSREN